MKPTTIDVDCNPPDDDGETLLITQRIAWNSFNAAAD
jgi:hypothetical protein